MKKKIIIVLTLSILIIGIVVTLIIVNNKPETKLNNNTSSTDVEENKNDENNQIINADEDEKNEEKDLEENKEVKQEESNKNNNDVKQDTKKEDEKKNTNTKSNSSSRNNSTNSTSNNNQQPKPQETAPAATETKYYAQCNGPQLEAGKKLTESQIRAKYPVVTNLKSSAEIAEDLSNDLPGFTSQVGIPNSLSNLLTTCQWTSTDNKNVLGHTPIVELYLNNTFEKYQTLAPEEYNKYLNIWNSVAYKDAYGKKRTIAEYYYINGKKQWRWNPNNLHF